MGGTFKTTQNSFKVYDSDEKKNLNKVVYKFRNIKINLNKLLFVSTPCHQHKLIINGRKERKI